MGLEVASDKHNELEEALERYGTAHPDAADTVDGVRHWWLGDPALSRDDVEAALEALVTRGLLDARRLPGGIVIYFNRAARDPRSSRP